MTRFIITLDQGVNLVISSLSRMYGGEIFVPKLPSIRIIELVDLMGENLKYKLVGIRAGEKLHEVMIPSEEIRNTVDMGSYYVVQPNHHWWNISKFKREIEKKGKTDIKIEEYSSSTNHWWLSKKELKGLINSL